MSSTASTSARALQSVDKESLDARILQFFRERGYTGATDDEIIESTGILHQSVGPRRQALWLRGGIINTGLERETHTGRKAVVWRIQPEYRWEELKFIHWRQFAEEKFAKGSKMVTEGLEMLDSLDRGEIPGETPDA